MLAMMQDFDGRAVSLAQTHIGLAFVDRPRERDPRWPRGNARHARIDRRNKIGQHRRPGRALALLRPTPGEGFDELWAQLTPEASLKVRRGNYERLFDAGVRLPAHRGCDDRPRDDERENGGRKSGEEELELESHGGCSSSL